MVAERRQVHVNLIVRNLETLENGVNSCRASLSFYATYAILHEFVDGAVNLPELSRFVLVGRHSGKRVGGGGGREHSTNAEARNFVSNSAFLDTGRVMGAITTCTMPPPATTPSNEPFPSLALTPALMVIPAYHWGGCF